MVNADYVAALTTRHAILSNMEGLLRCHRSAGYGRAQVSDVRAEYPAAKLAMLTTRWRVFDQNEALLWDWLNSYQLADYGNGWKIVVSTTHGSAS